MYISILLYFAQRESFILLASPLFATAFQAWKYGPVITEIRAFYRQDNLKEKLSADELAIYQGVFDKVFEQYAPMDSWSLSSISHGEYSRKAARQGVPFDENSNNLLDIKDYTCHFIIQGY